jgi:hypothetical protein
MLAMTPAQFAGAWPPEESPEKLVEAYTQEILRDGNWDEAEQALTQRLREHPGNDHISFGLAMIRFVHAIEKFGQHHYRHGLEPATSTLVPFLRLPVPANPNPERLTYELQRAALQSFLDDLAKVESTLAAMRGKEVKLVLDLEQVKLNFAPGVQGGEPATLMNVVRRLTPRAARRPVPDTGVPFEVAFDRADAIWLEGYCHLLSAGLEFILAHDWREQFAASGGMFYPHLRQPAEAAAMHDISEMRKHTAEIADAVTLVHGVRWQPAEPARLLKVRDHLKQVIALSRENWMAILAETDDDREWLPSPAQKNAAMPAMQVTQERLDVWLAALDEFDAVLDGRMLVPHAMFNRGFNLRRVLEEPRTFDLVLWFTGPAAVPYLEDGPAVNSATWQAWQRVFGGDFLIFAAYFN